MILPCGAFDGVDNPAEGDTPYVIFLALGQHGAEAVLGREDFAAEQDGVDRVGAVKGRGSDNIRHEIFGGGQPDGHFGSRLEAQFSEHDHQHELKQTVECCRHWFGIEHAFAVLAVGFLRVAEVLFDRHEDGAARVDILPLGGLRRVCAR
jgi:hypothetical protein